MSLPYKPPVLSHVQQVQRLYKRALKLSLDWHIRRDLWRINALEIRQRFEANRYISEPKKIAHIIGLTEQELEDRSHPDPYLYPTQPEGTKWERHGLMKPLNFKSSTN
ncbi:hypothetical protein CONCODRAFT_57168 [Conidiobolus coronatus NRRL 28638]|uniref:NADH dehydrogenase [ubiquinone] 1 beta subcomplex subunit 9 n=1 Tax=Conidiobolus coronatus (strain ATCC 28846 / CBS 209.66 / NRRL 28638) TaxID=796925 RepID=A0A137P9K2_CONC2|nr:hypothetical protein CONCODRAFT_57168 [Conidiobolus coronatus NRRL 28638]|eukprot:KXN71680.1 hypothetical protein CONCODRAFT_57168 [Conidiobolus coronatus NRRL 28638]